MRDAPEMRPRSWSGSLREGRAEPAEGRARRTRPSHVHDPSSQATPTETAECALAAVEGRLSTWAPPLLEAFLAGFPLDGIADKLYADVSAAAAATPAAAAALRCASKGLKREATAGSTLECAAKAVGPPLDAQLPTTADALSLLLPAGSLGPLAALLGGKQPPTLQALLRAVSGVLAQRPAISVQSSLDGLLSSSGGYAHSSTGLLAVSALSQAAWATVANISIETAAGPGGKEWPLSQLLARASEAVAGGATLTARATGADWRAEAHAAQREAGFSFSPPADVKSTSDTLTISSETDAVYAGVSGDVVLADSGRKAPMTISNQLGWSDTVIWNPYGSEAMGFDSFICVESAQASMPVPLSPGEYWTGAMDVVP